MSDPGDVSFIVPVRIGILRSLACALGIHDLVSPSFGPRYCGACGESTGREWTWTGTTHDFRLGFSTVHYAREDAR